LGDLLKGSRTRVDFAEGSETDEFWAAIGGKTEYNDSAAAHPDVEPRLFQCSDAKGDFRVEEIPNFMQEDMNDEDVFMLDTFTEIYMWFGSKSGTDEQKLAAESAEKFVKNADDGRDSDCPILRVCAGFEPPMFTQHFIDWDPKRNYSSDAAYERHLKELGSAFDDTTVRRISAGDIGFVDTATYSYEELKGKGNCPTGVDPSKKEEHLSDDEFMKLFKMSKSDFAGMAKWKRDKAKKSLDLF
jgi:hypothetical protein